MSGNQKVNFSLICKNLTNYNGGVKMSPGIKKSTLRTTRLKIQRLTDRK